MAAEGIQLRLVDEQVLATLDRIERLAAQPGAIMETIASYMVTATQRHIERETGPEGKWKPLSPRTAARRIGSGRRGTANMLRVTHRLYSSITGEATNDTAAVGTNLIYGPIQQLGGTINMPARSQEIRLAKTNRGRRFARKSNKRAEARTVQVGAHTITIPARPYLYVDDEDRAEILRIAEDAFAAEAGQR